MTNSLHAVSRSDCSLYHHESDATAAPSARRGYLSIPVLETSKLQSVHKRRSHTDLALSKTARQ